MERVGLYPGTFDPVTMGHMDIIGRGMKLVDRLIIGVAVSEAKKPLFSLEERIAMMEEECGALEGPGRAKIEVKPFDMLLMHFAEQEEVNVIVRGLRAVSDFEYEFQMTAMNEQLNREIETVFLMSDPENQVISSRFVKEIAKLNGKIDNFVTKSAKKAIKFKYD